MDKEYLLQVAKTVGLVLLAVAMTLYIGWHLSVSFEDNLSTVVAEITTEYDSLSFEAYIMRQETLLFASGSGSVTGLVDDGEKVRVGEAVAGVYSAESSENRARIAEIEAQIELLEQSKAGYGLTVKDTRKVDAQLSKLLLEARTSVEAGDYSHAASIRTELLTLINKRSVITAGTADYDAKIASLKSELARLSASAGSAKETVYAGVSGYYYSTADGYESIFSSSAVSTMTHADFESMRDSPPSAAASSPSCAGKLALSSEWYIAISAPTDALRVLAAGETYGVSFPYNDGETLDMQLYRISGDTGDARVLLIFRTDMMPPGFVFTRVQPVSVRTGEHTGFKLPLTALRVVGGHKGVYVLTGRKVEFKRVNVLLETENFFLAEGGDGDGWLKPFDQVITEGRDLYDGKMIT